MRKRTFGIIMTGSAVCLLTACNTVKVQSWTNPQFEGRVMGKTMVLGITKDNILARQYEALFVEQLQEQGIEGDLVHSYVNDIDKISKEELVEALQQNNFDSILITRLLSKTDREQTFTTGYPRYYRDYDGFYHHANYSSSTITRKFKEYELETNLYDVKTKERVWTGYKKIYDDRSNLSNIKRIIKGVVKDLRKQGMID